MDKETGSVICASGMLFWPNRSVRCEGTGWLHLGVRTTRERIKVFRILEMLGFP